MSRVYNFSAGPSMLPDMALKTAANEMLDYNKSGQSVMEMSHRSEIFKSIIDETESLLRKLLSIPLNYKVLFLQGGASTQFSAIPLNLGNKNKKADYIITGLWSQKAYKEALKYIDALAVASSKDKNFSYIPKTSAESFRKDADYVYICLNNTIYGTTYITLPETGNIPLVADASSCFLSKPIDITKFGVIFAGAQKNAGCAGLTVVIIRDDLLKEPSPITPTMLSYKVHAEYNSMYNTPPTFAIYMCKLVLEWLDTLGGLSKMEQINKRKASILYDYLDQSRLFYATAEKNCRSLMNIPFVTNSDLLNSHFIKEAEKSGFINLKGHRSVGGMRASIYNAMPTAGVIKLKAFMEKFEKENG